MDGKNTRALRGLGNVLIAQDQPDLAIAEFQKVLALDSKDYRAYNGLGVAHDASAQHSKAQEYYYAGLEIVPGDINLRSNLGLSLAFAGHYKGAIDVLRPLAQRTGATPRDRQNLALAYGLAGERGPGNQIFPYGYGQSGGSEKSELLRGVTIDDGPDLTGQVCPRRLRAAGPLILLLLLHRRQ